MKNAFILQLSGFITSLLVISGGASWADNTCHTHTNSTDRLQCYDEQTGFAEEAADTAAVSVTTQSQPSGEHWNMSEETSNLDGRTDVWLSVDSNNTQPNQIGRAEKPRLWVRCMDNSTNLFIAFNDYTPDDQNVRYKLDEGKIQKIWMVHMQGGKGVGLWSGRSAIPFTKKLFDQDTMIVAYKSYNNLNLEFSFDVSGLRDRIDPLATSCGWNP